MIDVMGGIASATAAIGIAKEVKAAIDSVADAETKIQMSDLISKLADVKMESAEQLSRIAELEQQLAVRIQKEYTAPNYWQVKGSGQRDGPFCQKCYL